MDFRKFDSYVILLAIVVVAGLLVSMVARFVILANGYGESRLSDRAGYLRDILSDHYSGIFQRG